MSGEMIFGPEHRLATYGTLAPGRANERQLSMMRGRWTVGTVRGHLKDAGWGSAMGYPGIILDPAGPEVEVHVFEAKDLPDQWARLDAFEGEGYRRVETDVDVSGVSFRAFIYELAL